MKSRLFKLLAFTFVLAMLCTAFVLPSFASNGSSGTMADTTKPGDVMKVSANLTLHSNFDYNIIVAVKDGVKLKSVKVNGVEVTVSVTNEAEYQVDGHKTHVAKHHGIAPASANDSFEVEFTVVLSDKSELVATQTHSIAKYAEKILGGVDVNDEYSEAEQVIIDMLAYIEAAYSYEGKECPEITSARGGRNPSNKDKDKENTNTSLAGTGITSAQLYLGNQPSIRFYLKDTFDGEVKIKYTSLDGVEHELTPDIETASDGRFFVQFSLRIYNMTRVFYVDVDGLVGTFDVYDYLSLLDDSDPAKQLVSSLIGYSSTSKEYKAPDMYTVRLDSDGGEYHSDKMIEKGKDFNLPPQANKYGHKFKGWYHGDEKIEEGFVPDGDVVITAKWESVLSEGLEYELSSDKSYYIVSGIGTCTDTDLIIPLTYEGLPVKEIGSSAFEGCKTVESVTIPVTVKTIGSSAFSGCSSLVSVDIPEKLSIIGELAFEETESMKEVNVHKDNKHYKSKDGNLYNKDETKFIHYPAGKVEVEFIIPSSITEIENYSFYNCKNLTNIIIPDSVVSIGKGAFCDCDNLINVTIPNSVTSIGSSAFSDCYSLTSVNIPNSVTSIGDDAFFYCVSLTNIKIPDNVNSIGDSVFQWCHNLTSVVIPESVTNIGDDAFNGCNSLTSIEIPESVTSIGCGAFSYCKGLMNIEIPDGVISIASRTFYNCGNLRNVKIPNSVTSIGDYAFDNCYSLTSISIPDSVTSIGSYAFSSCNSLTSISIPDSVTSIGSYAFCSCDSLVSVTIPNSVTSIEYAAFSGCDNLTSIEIPNSVETIGSSAFSNCSSLETVTFREKSRLLHIDNNAFSDCYSLISVAIPDSVTSIGDYAFDNCYSLTNLTIGSDVTSIGDFVFVDCYKLIEIYNRSALDIKVDSDIYGSVAYYARNIYTPNSGQSKLYTTNEGYIFYEDGDDYYLVGCTGNETDLILPESCNGKNYSIYAYAFYCHEDLTSVIISDSVTSIGGSAFESCYSLTSVIISDSVTSIGGSAFESCYSLTNLTIGSGVTSIGGSVFSKCYKLIEVYNRSALNIKVGSIIYGDVAYYARNVYTPNSGESKLYTTNEGYIFYEDGDACYLVGYTGSEVDLIFPESCNDKNYSIYEYAFYCREDLAGVIIPDSVTSIGDYAFYSCSALETITFGENSQLLSIGNYAFPNCNSFTNIEIPDNVESIGSSAFANCDSLTNVEIPNSVETIGGSAFYNCSALKTVTFGENSQLTSIDNGVFSYCVNLTSIEIPDSVKIIGSSAFSYCSALETVTFGENSQLSNLGFEAFRGCKSLTSITIPNSVTSIGNSAFRGCTSVTNVIVGDCVASIGNSAFAYCTNLISIEVDPNNSSYMSIDGNLYSKDGKTLIQYAIGKSETDFIISEDVESIAISAFGGCTSLTSIKIPNSVTSIGDGALHQCSKLSDIYYGGTQLTWSKIAIGKNNECLTNATIHCEGVDVDYKDEYDFLNDTPMIGWDEEFVAD